MGAVYQKTRTMDPILNFNKFRESLYASFDYDECDLVQFPISGETDDYWYLDYPDLDLDELGPFLTGKLQIPVLIQSPNINDILRYIEYRKSGESRVTASSNILSGCLTDWGYAKSDDPWDGFDWGEICQSDLNNHRFFEKAVFRGRYLTGIHINPMTDNVKWLVILDSFKDVARMIDLNMINNKHHI